MQRDDFDNLYGSKYFSVADLNGGQTRVKIGKTDVQEVREKDGSKKLKYALYFEGHDKALLLNKTNAKKLADVYGKDRNAWVGNSIELYSETTTFGEGVRLRPLRKPATVNNLDPDLSDAVPF
jgi:hypothetical protein